MCTWLVSQGRLIVDAITLSVTRLAENAQLSSDVAGLSRIIAAVMNTVSKGAISYFSGSPELRRPVIRAFMLIILVGAVSVGLFFFSCNNRDNLIKMKIESATNPSCSGLG